MSFTFDAMNYLIEDNQNILDCQVDKSCTLETGYAFYNGSSCQLKLDAIFNHTYELLPAHIRKSELVIKYFTVIINSLDFRKSGYGLLNIDSESIGGYERDLDFTFRVEDLEQCRRYLVLHSPYYGMGCFKTAEYRKLLLDCCPRRETVCFEQILRIQQDYKSGRLLLKSHLPRGPFDLGVFNFSGAAL